MYLPLSMTAFTLGSQANSTWALDFKPDGTKMYYGGVSDHRIPVYLFTAFDINTASYDSKF